MKKKEGEYLVHLDSITREEKTVGDRSVFFEYVVPQNY